MHSVSTNFSVQFACFPKVFVIKFQTNKNGFQLMLFFNQALDVKSLFQMAMDKSLWLILCATSTYICSCFFRRWNFSLDPNPDEAVCQDWHHEHHRKGLQLQVNVANVFIDLILDYNSCIHIKNMARFFPYAHVTSLQLLTSSHSAKTEISFLCAKIGSACCSPIWAYLTVVIIINHKFFKSVHECSIFGWRLSCIFQKIHFSAVPWRTKM